MFMVTGGTAGKGKKLKIKNSLNSLSLSPVSSRVESCDSCLDHSDSRESVEYCILTSIIRCKMLQVAVKNTNYIDTVIRYV